MRSVLLLLIVMLVLGGCAHQKAAVAPSGVSYFADFDNKLQKVITIKPKSEGVNPVAISGTPVWTDEMIYLPVTSYSRTEGKSLTTTGIYAYDNTTGAITDSLIFSNPAYSINARNVIINGDIYIVGVKDSVCTVYQTDRHLKLIKEYNTGIRTGFVQYADFHDTNLRVLCVPDQKVLMLYYLHPDTMLPDFSQAQPFNANVPALDHDKLYFFTPGDNDIEGIRYDFSQSNPEIWKFTISVSIPKDSAGMQTFRVQVCGDIAYISYSGFHYKNGLGATFIAYNMIDGTMRSIEEDGLFTWDLLPLNGKTYIYHCLNFMNARALQVSELNSDLTESNPKVSFMFSDSNFSRQIIPYKDKSVLLTGYYQVKNGKQSTLDMKDMGKFKMDEYDTTVFMGVLGLK